MARILWQLKRLSTNEPLNELQELPDNWKNISSLKGSIDRLGDLSWAGHKDMGWFEIGPAPDPATDKGLLIQQQIQAFLDESADKVSIENSSITKAERIAWMEYRQALKEMHLQLGYPESVFWPVRPE